MNETSRGGPTPQQRGDPPIGGFDGGAATSSSNAASSSATAASTTDETLGSDLISDLGFSRLLGGESTWDFDATLGSTTAASAASSINRPWEMDLPSLGGAPGIPGVSTAPPNVLAPPPVSSRGLYAPPAPFYGAAPGAPGHAGFIDQRLPSFQSQFHQDQAAAQHAAAASAAAYAAASQRAQFSASYPGLLGSSSSFEDSSASYHSLQPRAPLSHYNTLGKPLSKYFHIC